MISTLKITDFFTNKNHTIIKEIPVETIRPNPYQSRKYFDKMSLDELVLSIKKYGIMQPINVRIINSKTYEVVCGSRRLRAVKELGLKTIPAIVLNVDYKESAVIALIENLQRNNLNYVEEAKGYDDLIKYYNYTIKEISARLVKTELDIIRKLKILQLPYSVLNFLIDKNFTEDFANLLIKIPENNLRLESINTIYENDLNIKDSRMLVNNLVNELRKNKKPLTQNKIIKKIRDTRLLTNTIKRSVEIMKKSGVEVIYEVIEKKDKLEIIINVPFE